MGSRTESRQGVWLACSPARDERGARRAAESPESPMDGPLAIRPRDAARVLGVSERTLWGWTAAGLIPCIRPSGPGKKGAAVLYSVATLRRWLTEHEAIATTDDDGDAATAEQNGGAE